MDSALTRLLAQLIVEVTRLWQRLEEGAIDPPTWRREMARSLAKGHAAAYMVGSGERELSPAARAATVRTVAAQLRFLDRFALQVQSAKEFRAGWRARAVMYAQGIGASFWRGRTRMLPLPFMPADGTTQCLTNCKCKWRIEQLEGDENYDCTWVLGAAEHCQTCVARAMDNPYRIRGGVLQ